MEAEFIFTKILKISIFHALVNVYFTALRPRYGFEIILQFYCFSIHKLLQNFQRFPQYPPELFKTFEIEVLMIRAKFIFKK